FSAPTPHGPPLMLDITTSMSAGGKVDVYRARGQQTPDGWLVDADGNPVNDPNRFKGSDVAMLPLGGPQGHKGYGLGMMIDAIAGGLSWAGCSSEQPTRGGSGYIAIAIKIDSFIDLSDYLNEIGRLCDWIKSSRTQPGVDKIYLPGEIEHDTRAKREAEGVFIEDETWDNTVETANELSVSIPEVR
ncbi:MAG: Ldh family oxidoreductase, partial [Gemmatimonadota bacterium]|nr:Ldh family oxidoreductase [Gemmatimonadota bacterium]